MDCGEEDDFLCAQALTQYESSISPNLQRFGQPVNAEYISSLGEKSIPKNTKKNMTWASKAFEEWRVARNRLFLLGGEDAPEEFIPWTSLEEMNDSDLNFALSRFITEARKQTGENYPANSLFQLITSIQGYLRMNNRPVSLLKNPIYKPIYDALDVHMKKATASCISKPSQAEIILLDLEESLWREGVLGQSNPQQLLHTLMYSLGLHFALRASEHKSLNFEEQLSIRTDHDGKIYLCYQETSSKSSQGGIKTRKRPQRCSRAYSNLLQRERCPVKIYSLYCDRCPTQNRPKPLYLHPLPNVNTSNPIWFARRPLGIHAIEGFLKTVTSQIGEEGKYTPHSLRATNATRLFHQGVPEQLIPEQTGHSSLAVRRYKRTSDAQKETISNLIQSTTPSQPNFNILGNMDYDSSEDFQEIRPQKKAKPSCTISVPPPTMKSTSIHSQSWPHQIRNPIRPAVLTPSQSTITQSQPPQIASASRVQTPLPAPVVHPIPRPNPIEINLPPQQLPIPMPQGRGWDPSNVELDIDTERKSIKIKINF